MTRHFGILSSHSLFRNLVVKKGAEIRPGAQLTLFSPEDLPIRTKAQEVTRIAWAMLLKRVFLVDVTVCERCGGEVHVLEAVTKKAEIRAQLVALGLPLEPPVLHPAREPPQVEFVFDEVS